MTPMQFHLSNVTYYNFFLLQICFDINHYCILFVGHINQSFNYYPGKIVSTNKIQSELIIFWFKSKGQSFTDLPRF